MRKFIVKYFALSYACKIGKENIDFPRASTPISMILIFIMLLSMFTEDMLYSDVQLYHLDILNIVLWGLFIVSLFFGFYYYKIRGNNVKYKELDEVQKYRFIQLTKMKFNSNVIIKNKPTNKITPLIINLGLFVGLIVIALIKYL